MHTETEADASDRGPARDVARNTTAPDGPMTETAFEGTSTPSDVFRGRRRRPPHGKGAGPRGPRLHGKHGRHRPDSGTGARTDKVFPACRGRRCDAAGKDARAQLQAA